MRRLGLMWLGHSVGLMLTNHRLIIAVSHNAAVRQKLFAGYRFRWKVAVIWCWYSKAQMIFVGRWLAQ